MRGFASGGADLSDSVEDALEANLRPYGDAESLRDDEGVDLPSAPGTGSDPGVGHTGAAERSEVYYQKVADQQIRQIERGTARSTQALQPGEKSMPRNVVTGEANRSGNSVWLASITDQRGLGDERWGTYKQVQGQGGQVRRGEKGSAILSW